MYLLPRFKRIGKGEAGQGKDKVKYVIVTHKCLCYIINISDYNYFIIIVSCFVFRIYGKLLGEVEMVPYIDMESPHGKPYGLGGGFRGVGRCKSN